MMSYFLKRNQRFYIFYIKEGIVCNVRQTAGILSIGRLDFWLEKASGNLGGDMICTMISAENYKKRGTRINLAKHTIDADSLFAILLVYCMILPAGGADISL